MAYVRISGSGVQGQSLKRTLTVTDEKCNRLANQRAESECLRGETMAGKGWKGKGLLLALCTVGYKKSSLGL